MIKLANEDIVTSRLSFSPVPDDDGTTLRCHGSNPLLPNSAIEDTMVMSVMCKYQIEQTDKEVPGKRHRKAEVMLEDETDPQLDNVQFALDFVVPIYFHFYARRNVHFQFDRCRGLGKIGSDSCQSKKFSIAVLAGR